MTCGIAEVCVSDRCTSEVCVGVTCPPGSVCSGGSCFDTRCNGLSCPSGQVCANDTCIDVACVGVACPAGRACKAGACVDPCANVTCGASETCRDGTCVNACLGVTCGTGQVCRDGACLDACIGVGCDGGMECRSGACVDACLGVSCDGGTSCRNGACVDSCLGVSCTGGQVCRNGGCVDVCAGVNCMMGEVCRNGACVDACTTVACDGGTTCQAGACIDDACLTVRCSAGKVCSLGNCVDPQCVGVSCTNSSDVCSQGTCVNRCTVTCGGTCPLCTAGRTCGGNSECESHLCKNTLCTACDTTTNLCPNGATCMNGICRSGVGGPCTVVTDCNTGLVCEDMICKLPAGANCTGAGQCVKAVVCENLVCQQPRCQLQLLETQTVPNFVTGFNTLASGYVQATGELYVSHGQWDNNYANSSVRRFRVAPGQAPVEQSPTMAPLMSVAVNDPTPQGSSTFAGTAASAYAGRSFYWYAGGGPWDGRLTMKLDFINFNADISLNLNNGGRFTNCGTEWIFLSNVLSSPKVMTRWSTGVVAGSSAQTALINLTASAARRDTWPFPAMMDIKCFNDRVWALGNSGGVVQLQKLFLTNLAADGTPVSFPGVSPLNGGLDEAQIFPVTDTHFYVTSRAGSIYELYNGRQQRIGAVTGEPVAATPQGLVTYGGGVVRRYEKRMMDGTVPPLDTVCNWQ